MALPYVSISQSNISGYRFDTDSVYQSSEVSGASFISADKSIIYMTGVSANEYGYVPYVRAVDTGGHVLWTSDRKVFISSSLRQAEMIGGYIYLSIADLDGTNEVWKVDLSSGNIAWKAKTTYRLYSFCNYTNNRILVSFYGGPISGNQLMTLDKTTGTFGTPITTTKYPIWTHLINDGQNRIYAYDIDSGPGYMGPGYFVRLDTAHITDTLWSCGISAEHMVFDSLGNIYVHGITLKGQTQTAKVNPANGKFVWIQYVGAQVFTLSGKYLYSAEGSTSITSLISGAIAEVNLTKFTADSGKTVWFNRMNYDTFMTPGVQGSGTSTTPCIQVDEKGDVYTLFSLQNTLISPFIHGILKFSGTDGSLVYRNKTASPIFGLNYNGNIVNMSYLYGRIYLMGAYDILSDKEKKDSLYGWSSKKVAHFICLDPKDGNPLFWNIYEGTWRLTSSVIKQLPMPGKKFALLRQHGMRTEVTLMDSTNKELWTTAINGVTAYDMAVNGLGDIGIIGQRNKIDYTSGVLIGTGTDGNRRFLDQLNILVCRIDMAGKITERSEYTGNSNVYDSLIPVTIFGDSADFFFALSTYSNGTSSSAMVGKMSNNNVVFTGLYPGSSGSSLNAFSKYNKDTILFGGYEAINKNTMYSNSINTFHVSNPDVRGWSVYETDTATIVGPIGFSCLNKKLNKLYWTYKYMPNMQLLKVLPAGNGNIFAVGTGSTSTGLTCIAASKIRIGDGKVLWTRNLVSKYGNNSEIGDAFSDSTLRYLVVAGGAQITKKTNDYAAALWQLNDNGDVIDSAYNEGDFPAHSSINSIVKSANKSLVISGQISKSDYVAGFSAGYIPVANRYLMGKVYKNDKTTPMASVKVFAVQFYPADSSIKAIDSTITDSKGNYVFKLQDSISRIYVKALPTASAYPDQLPSYADSALFFRSASAVVITKDSVVKDIVCVKGFNAGGKGFLGGKIALGANKKAGDPVDNLQLFLVDNKTFVTGAVTNLNGGFGIGNIAPKSYLVYVDVPTVDNTKPPVIVMNDAAYNFPSLSFLLHRHYLELVSGNTGVQPENKLTTMGLNTFPNPFKEELNVSYELLEKDHVAIELLNIATGSVIVKLEDQVQPAGKYQATYPVLNVAAGLYLLRVQTGDTYTVKMVNKL